MLKHKVRAIYTILSVFFIFNHVNGQATTIPANTDIGTCTCDLTPGLCDVGCCCDKSCSSSDRLTFLSCTNTFKSENSQLCSYKSEVNALNTVVRSTNVSGNLLCIYNDNYLSRNYYEVKSTVTTETQFESLLSSIQGSRFAIPTLSWTSVKGFTNNYKNGDPIYTYYPTSIFGLLSFPGGQGSVKCSEESPVSFLTDRTTKCSRTLSTLSTSCTTDTTIDLSSYISSFKIANRPEIFSSILNNAAGNVSMPGNYNDTNLLLINLNTLTCLDINGNTEFCNATLSSPVYTASSSTCSRVLKSLTLTVVYDGTTSITSVNANAVLSSITTTTIEQSFTVKFGQNITSDPERSGNPGYLIGKPILAGNKSASHNYVQLSSNSNYWLTTITSGTCSLNLERTPVLFGIATTTTCTVTIKSDVGSRCSYLDTLIKQALLGASAPNVIATFGNISPEKIGDWIPITTVGGDGNVDSSIGAIGCTQLIVGAKLTILYSRIGASVNPQNKIVGAQMQFTRSEIKFSCRGTRCLNPATLSSATQILPITMDVVFLDTSINSSLVEKAKPVFLARLPYDFFYPFFVDSSPRTSSTITAHVLCLTISFLYRYM